MKLQSKEEILKAAEIMNNKLIDLEAENAKLKKDIASKNEALASRDNAIEILRQAILWDKVDPKFAFKILQDTIAKQALEKK